MIGITTTFLIVLSLPLDNFGNGWNVYGKASTGLNSRFDCNKLILVSDISFCENKASDKKLD